MLFWKTVAKLNPKLLHTAANLTHIISLSGKQRTLTQTKKDDWPNTRVWKPKRFINYHWMVLILHQSGSMDFLIVNWINHSNEKLDLKPHNSGVRKTLWTQYFNRINILFNVIFLRRSMKQTRIKRAKTTGLKKKFKQRLTIK